MTAKERHVGNIFTAVGDRHFATVFLQGKEGNDFIVRAFGVKLHLGMLVGNTERFYRGLPNVARLAVEGNVLAKGFRPELTIPVRKEFQVIRIGHHNADVFTLLHGNMLKCGKH